MSPVPPASIPAFWPLKFYQILLGLSQMPSPISMKSFLTSPSRPDLSTLWAPSMGTLNFFFGAYPIFQWFACFSFLSPSLILSLDQALGLTLGQGPAASSHTRGLLSDSRAGGWDVCTQSSAIYKTAAPCIIIRVHEGANAPRGVMRTSSFSTDHTHFYFHSRFLSGSTTSLLRRVFHSVCWLLVPTPLLLAFEKKKKNLTHSSHWGLS